jgi:hypothetical protein
VAGGRAGVGKLETHGHRRHCGARRRFLLPELGVRRHPNRIEVKVTNLWANRMIGDQLLPEDKRYTFSMFKPYKKDSPLLESGLLGPVKLSVVTPRVVTLP